MDEKSSKKEYLKNNSKKWQKMLDEWKELPELERNALSIECNNNTTNNKHEESEKKIKLTKEDVEKIKNLLKERSIRNIRNPPTKLNNQNEVKLLNEKVIYDKYKKYCDMEKEYLGNLLNVIKNSEEHTTSTSSLDGNCQDISNASASYLEEKFRPIIINKVTFC